MAVQKDLHVGEVVAEDILLEAQGKFLLPGILVVFVFVPGDNGMDGEVHGARIEGGQLGLEVGHHPDPLVGSHARDAAGSDADDRITPCLDARRYLPVDFRVRSGLRRHGITGMDVHGGRPSLCRPHRIVDDLLRRGGKVRRLDRQSDIACERGGYD